MKLGAGIGTTNPSGGGASVPVVDDIIKLHARISTSPSAFGNLSHQIFGMESLTDLSCRAENGLPRLIVQISLHELLTEPHRIIGILAGNTLVGLPVEISRVSGLNQRLNL